jgi:hypothetical protein
MATLHGGLYLTGVIDIALFMYSTTLPQADLGYLDPLYHFNRDAICIASYQNDEMSPGILRLFH